MLLVSLVRIIIFLPVAGMCCNCNCQNRWQLSQNAVKRQLPLILAVIVKRRLPLTCEYIKPPTWEVASSRGLDVSRQLESMPIASKHQKTVFVNFCCILTCEPVRHWDGSWPPESMPNNLKTIFSVSTCKPVKPPTSLAGGFVTGACRGRCKPY